MKHFLGLGSNMGDRKFNLLGAIAALSAVIDVEATSSLYESEAVGGPKGQGRYLNMAIVGASLLEPSDLLRHCMDIERDFGRTRVVPNGPRTLDIDILFADGVVIHTDDLVVPHPRLHLRGFVLAPLFELDPKLVTTLQPNVAQRLRLAIWEPGEEVLEGVWYREFVEVPS